MKVHLESAIGLGISAKDWSNSNTHLGDGSGPIVLSRASKTVVEFVHDKPTPTELKLAAAGLWLAIEHASHGMLYGAARERRQMFHTSMLWRRYIESDDHWKLTFIRDGVDGSKEVPRSLGLLMTRRVAGSTDPAYFRAANYDRRREPEPQYADAYVWVAPEARGQGVATTALDHLSSYANGIVLRMPFDVDPYNLAAAKLVERFNPGEAVPA